MAINFVSSPKEGPKLNYDKYNLPNVDNLYGAITNINTNKKIAEDFYGIKWRVRKSSWTEFEIINEWCEFQVTMYNEQILIDGIIDETRVDELVKLFKGFKYDFSISLHAKDKSMRKISG